ncbi:retrovirus-related pol polyprotein from transposon TNT 1-94 [Tanacetum coccineum]|uniref:Retrovirus-related pol polyprotein from transposon TNT 1-94 n=1 Tax=Tanacetum coccineum TaxID=301880 RepID=A0ABQ5EUU1_9ASTR
MPLEQRTCKGRRIIYIDEDEDITLVNVQDDVDNEMFDVDTVTGDEVFAEQEVVAKDVNLTVDEVTLSQALAALKSVKPKVKGDIIKEPSIPVSADCALIKAKVHDKVKEKMIEPEKSLKKKDLIRLDEELASKLQAEFDEEETLAREKDKANVSLTKEWDDIQAKIKADHELAERLQAEEQEELSIEEKAKLFQQLLEKRRKHLAAKRAEDQRNKPPTQAQQRKIMCIGLKNMEGKKLKDLKNKSFDFIQKMFDKAFNRVNTFVNFKADLVEGGSKRTGEELEQESTKKQKVDEDKDTTELQSLMEVILDEEEVEIDTVPLATKSPITAALIDVNAAQLKLKLLENFNESYSKCLRLLKDYKAEYKKMKAKLALLEASPSSSHNPKSFQPNNKGLVAETFDWANEEEVSNVGRRPIVCPVQIRGGVLAESSQSNESSIGVKCDTCGSTVHSTTDHNEFDHFKRASESENWLCHKRLHISIQNINKIAKQNKVLGLPSLVYSKDKRCTTCEKGKQHRDSFKTKQNFSIRKCLHRLHMDLFGPVSPMSINHKKYTLVIVDEYSRYTWVQFLKKKHQAAEIIMSFIRMVENQNDVKVKQIRTDNGTEFRNHELKSFYDEKGISQNFYSPYTPEQNVGTERKNQNSHYSLLNNAEWLSTPLRESFFSKAFRVFNTRRQQVEETYHITFDESMEAIKFTNTSDDPSRQYQVNSDVSYYIIPHGRSLVELTQENQVLEVIAPNEPEIPHTKDTKGNNTEVSGSITESLVPDVTQSHISNHAFTSSHHVPQDRWSRDQHIELMNIIGDPGESMLTRSMATKLIAASASECLFADFLSEIEPKKVFEALKHPGWVDAMQEELIL